MKTHLLLSLFFLITLVSVAQDYKVSPVLVNAREIVDKGVKSYDDGKYDEALAEYLQIPENDTV